MGGWLGGWVGEIEDKVHLSPAEAEIGAELGKSMDNFHFINVNVHETRLNEN